MSGLIFRATLRLVTCQVRAMGAPSVQDVGECYLSLEGSNHYILTLCMVLNTHLNLVLKKCWMPGSGQGIQTRRYKLNERFD